MKLLVLLLVFTCIVAVRCVTTHTPSGDIEGFTLNGVDVYLGVRYGQFSERWTPAKLPLPWTGIQNATSFGPICHQFGPFTSPFKFEESEQCLSLNVWVPSERNASLLPVSLWLHGGGYTAGDSNDYDARNLSDVSQSIIVTINYRLGIFGFFPLPAVESRNFGWSDQQLALQWVQENIASFGGDKTNVMLFGQSAGGGSTMAHLLIESSWPLYSSAILQSGAPFIYDKCEEREEINLKLLETSFPECESNITCFRQLNASLFYETLTINWITLWPCVGQRSQLEDQPLTLIRKGIFNRNVPIIGGINSNEGQTSVLTFNQFNMNINSSQYRPFATEYRIPDNLTDLYDPTTTDKDYFTALTWLFGDYYIHCPTLFLFDYLSVWSSSIYAYFFVHATENWAFTPFHFNASHLTEIPYVFDNDFALTKFTLAEFNLSMKIIRYFNAFHLKEQPWSSYTVNQTVIVFNISNDDSMQSQSTFGERLIKQCPIILKYVDSDNCHAYTTREECIRLQHCHWISDRCDFSSTTLASTTESTSLTPTRVSTSLAPTTVSTSSSLFQIHNSFLFFVISCALFLINK
ncbi:unnamed protein product [Rotaria socialis]|uniref:Carboxylic ester hydrolase n=1 Tax=Rotaria socialis TaxID=392032 RepID=A0A820N7G5_9BILA|nr:unnamed protein product [Rotaria socialis]CAF3468772.1 unnamed protein product [Rotaria socialis]CAF4207421.1 unnamed protein product [Rotaria socialis]CAF4383417.1 unnamed protein product [Rotaria socialis]